MDRLPGDRPDLGALARRHGGDGEPREVIGALAQFTASLADLFPSPLD